MIINNTSSNDVIKIGENNSKQATINQDKMAKLQSMLTSGLYQDPISACITEWSNNAIDSIVMSGKDPIENPTIVKLYKEDDNYFLTISDNGLGLDKDEFENVVMNYLTSTKENSSSAIGHFGIGCKAFMSLNRPSEWLCVKNGIEYKFLAYKGSEFLEYDLIYEQPTKKENGVEIKLKINDYNEYNKFVSKAKRQLSYYSEITLIIDEIIHKNTIYRNDLFQFCDKFPYSEIHLCLKDVVYNIKWSELGIESIDVPIALRFNLDSGLIPSISRETLVYNNFTKELILNRIKEVATFFVNKYNETTHYDNFIEAYDYIDNDTHYVKICNQDFVINELEEYSNVKNNEVTIKNIKNLDIKKFKKNISKNLDYYYNVYAIDTEKGRWKKDKLNKEDSLFRHFLLYNKNVVIVNEIISGKIKSFLRDKYGTNTYYIYQKNAKRWLKSVVDDYSYYSILFLKSYPKEQWRALIFEYQMLLKEITNNFNIENNIEVKKSFIAYCDEVKKTQKQKRIENKISNNYVSKSINKEKGDITINLFVSNKYYTALKKETFTKSINKLNGVHKLTVYFDKTNDNIPHNLYDYYNTFNKNIDFVVLNTTEIKHVQHLHQFITFKQFKMSKPFARLATAILAHNLLNSTPSEDLDLINECFPQYQILYDNIIKYRNDNFQKNISSFVEKILLDELIENNGWDQNIYPELMEYKKVISKFGFLNYMKNINDWRTSDEEKAIIKNIVYVMYKNNKINHESVENMILVPKSSLCIDNVNTNQEIIITQSLAEKAGVEI